MLLEELGGRAFGEGDCSPAPAATRRDHRGMLVLVRGSRVAVRSGLVIDQRATVKLTAGVVGGKDGRQMPGLNRTGDDRARFGGRIRPL